MEPGKKRYGREMERDREKSGKETYRQRAGEKETAGEEWRLEKGSDGNTEGERASYQAVQFRPQDHFQRGLDEDLFADLHLSWPVHAGKDGGIPGEKAWAAHLPSSLPLGSDTRNLTLWALSWVARGPPSPSLWPTPCWHGFLEQLLNVSASTSSSVK